MSDILRANNGAKIKAQTNVSKRRVNLADANTITESMLRDSSVTTNKIADLNNVRLIDSGNSNHLQLQSDSTPDQTADRIVSVDSENLAATLRLQGLAKVLPCESYLVDSDFPNTTTLYGWHLNSTDPTAPWVGGITTSENGSIASSTDHLGNTADCEFDGSNDYLSSADAAFAFTGNFSVGGWFYTASGFSANQALITRIAGTATGFRLYTSSDGNLYIQTYNSVGGNNTTATYPYASIPSGWTHICGTRSASTMRLYVNGKWVGSYAGGAPLSYAAAGYFEIGSQNSGSNKFTGRIAEVVVHDGTAWSENEVRKIYSRGARRLAALDQNGSIQIPQNETIYYPQRTLTITNGDWTTVKAIGIPYVDALGNWRLKGNVAGSKSGGAVSSYTMNIAGVVFDGTASFYQAISVSDSSGTQSWQGYTSVGASGVGVSSSSSNTAWRVSFDVALASKPTI